MSSLTKIVFLLAFSSFIHAQDETWLSVSTITLGLSVSTSQAAIDAKDESGVVVTPKTKVYSNYFMDKKGAEINEGIATITKTRFSNLEFLRKLVSVERYIGLSRITSVVGWSIVYISGESVQGYYIRRKIRGGKFQYINIDEYLRDDNSEELYLQSSDVREVYNPSNDSYSINSSITSFRPATIYLSKILPHKRSLYGSYITQTNLTIVGIQNDSRNWDNTKSAYKLLGSTVVEATGVFPMVISVPDDYEYNNPTEIYDYDLGQVTTPAIVNGTITGGAGVFITSKSLEQGLISE
jgi:hypothetical protein